MILAPASKTQTSRFTSKRYHPDFHLVFLFGFFSMLQWQAPPHSLSIFLDGLLCFLKFSKPREQLVRGKIFWRKCNLRGTFEALARTMFCIHFSRFVKIEESTSPLLENLFSSQPSLSFFTFHFMTPVLRGIKLYI